MTGFTGFFTSTLANTLLIAVILIALANFF